VSKRKKGEGRREKEERRREKGRREKEEEEDFNYGLLKKFFYQGRSYQF